MTQKRFFFLISGCIGIVLLILPTVSFFLLTWDSSSRERTWHGRPFEFPCGILAAVWLCHLIYFLFGLKTLTEETGKEAGPA